MRLLVVVLLALQSVPLFAWAQQPIHPDAVPPKAKAAFEEATGLEAPTRWLHYRRERDYTAAFAGEDGEEVRLRISHKGELIMRTTWRRYNELPDTLVALQKEEKRGHRFRKAAYMVDFRTGLTYYKILKSRGSEIEPLMYDPRTWRLIPYETYDDVMLQEGGMD